MIVFSLTFGVVHVPTSAVFGVLILSDLEVCFY